MARPREKTIGNCFVRLISEGKEFAGMVLREDGGRIVLRGPNEEILWNQLVKEASKGSPDYFGYEGATNRFLHFFPNGFQSRGYADKERTYKCEAKDLLVRTVPPEHVLQGQGFGEAVLAVYRQTNLLEPRFELRKVEKVLRSPDADDFVRGAARFALEPNAMTLGRLEGLLRPHGAATWTIATYLPYLWLPERHMFLKPNVTKDYATRVGHRFAHEYEPALNIAVYDSLLDLAGETAHEIASLQPQDRIDIQSFIWVVGSYVKGEHLPQK